ncbi:hypothetical protein [Pectobacterium araliae]|uniref:hypothetical protein n=1 Tax=Pectobacterium araliae TaxID=3073862 RepID=UPI003CE5BBD8
MQQFGECQLPWLRQHSPFIHGIPRRHCIANIIKALDSESLMSALLSCMNLLSNVFLHVMTIRGWRRIRKIIRLMGGRSIVR